MLLMHINLRRKKIVASLFVNVIICNIRLTCILRLTGCLQVKRIDEYWNCFAYFEEKSCTGSKYKVL